MHNFKTKTKLKDAKIFVPLARNCTRSACTTWVLVSVLIRDGFGVSFVVSEVVQTILHFGNTVAVLLFVRKIHEVTPTHFFNITAFFISYLLNG